MGSSASPSHGGVRVACPRCGVDDAEQRVALVRSWIVTCRRCAMSYVNPRQSSERLAAKLEQWAEQDVVDEARLATSFEAGNLEHYGRLLALMQRHAGARRGSILDVGCSTGAFLTVARAAGWRAQGLEVGVASSAHARNALGLDVAQGSLYDAQPTAEGYDAVAFLEVIEHLERPAEALSRIHQLLAPRGLLLLTTPNFDSLYRRLFGGRWWVINCEDEHIVLFTLATLCGMLEEQGFEVLDARIRGLDLPGLAREAKQALRGRKDVRPGAAADSYYEDRGRRARLKSAFRRLGLLGAAKAALRGLDRTFAWRASPTYAWGEQLIVVARRR